jgi:hypothetical protein
VITSQNARVQCPSRAIDRLQVRGQACDAYCAAALLYLVTMAKTAYNRPNPASRNLS